MTARRSLLTVHAHPDDESSKGPATVARYHDLGVYTALVCCTGGEEGDILNPAMDSPDVKARMTEIRREELAAAAAVIGYDEVLMLGYRDSGMPGAESNANPDSFAMAALDDAVGRLVTHIRRVRPEVIVTYPDEQNQYPHPDHLRVHEISMLAFDAAGDPGAFPEAGSPFSPSKLYYTVWPVGRMKLIHEKFLELGLESPHSAEWIARVTEADDGVARHTTTIDVSGYEEIRPKALLCHATQVDPTSRMWFGLPPEIQASIPATEEYQLARSRVGPTDVVEDDLFALVEASA
jgi:mycothiol S-conjugate amidase